jgi:hypothetical protein
VLLNSNLCRAQADECLLLALEKPDDAITLSGVAAGWQTLADQIDPYHARQPAPDPAFGIPLIETRPCSRRHASPIFPEQDDIKFHLEFLWQNAPPS